jgi:acetoin utilization deacetylase AcuC-like enzyme
MPEMILVSYGFDPHWRDPLGHLQLSAGAYGELIASLAGWADKHCGGRIALFLEGGYDLEAAAACSLSVTAALLGKEWQDSLGVSPQTEGFSWQSTYRRARQIWEI